MIEQSLGILYFFCPYIIVLFIIGIYCVIMTANLIRALIGIEVLIKAATLLLIVAGYITGHVALAQSLVITLIVIEVVFMVVAVGIVLGIYRHYGSLDAKNLRNLKG
jgi:NADH:ubiquinone oxidoreductase subunit K